MNSNPLGERAVDPNNVSLSVVNDNRIRNSVDYADPLLAGTVYLIEQAGMIEQPSKKGTQHRHLFQQDLIQTIHGTWPR
jgi:hypothetical protein